MTKLNLKWEKYEYRSHPDARVTGCPLWWIRCRGMRGGGEVGGEVGAAADGQVGSLL